MDSTLKKIIDNMSEGCQIIDFEYNYVYVNKSLIKQSRALESKLIGASIIHLFPHKDNKEFHIAIKECMEKRISKDFEIESTFRDNSKSWLKFKIEPIDLGLVIFSVDISEKKKSEKILASKSKDLDLIKKLHGEALNKIKKNLKYKERVKAKIEIEKARDYAMLESIGVGVFAVDKDNKFILINKKAEELIGASAKSLLGKIKTPSSVSLENDDGKPIPLLERPTLIAIQTGRATYSSDYVLVHKDGTKIPISLTVTPIKLDGEIIGAIDVFRDITLEKQIDKSKTEFVSLASHQLRTPLGIVKWYMEALESEEYIKASPHVVKEYIQEIIKNNERLLELVRSLLSVSRIDQGRVRDDPKETDILEIIKDSVKQMDKIALRNKITISLEVSDSLPLMYIDPVRFTEVIENLLTNAIRYNKYAGTINVKVSTKNQKVIIKIEDTGIGISKEDLSQIYIKFFRSESAVIASPEGSGLGLYVVKSYIENWKGSIAVQSEVDKGSIFTITLPFKSKLNE